MKGQKEVAEMISKMLDIPLGDIKITTAGVKGIDVEVCESQKHKFPFDLEVKRVEKLNIWAAFEQASENSDLPAVAFRRNRDEWKICLSLEDFLALMAVNNLRGDLV